MRNYPINDPYPKIYLYRRIVQAKLFIDSRFAENIHLEQIAGEAYFTKYHFIRLFKKIYGKTPGRYLTTVRIDNAKEFLRNGMTVSNACYAAGFDSLSSFSGLFKKMTGLNPSSYLALQQQIREQIIKTPIKFIPGCFTFAAGR